MVGGRVRVVAVYADRVSTERGGNDGAERMADPFFQAHVHCLLMPGPIVFAVKCIGTERALKDLIGIRLRGIKFRSGKIAATATSLALP